ncbi:MAG: hypothetical protein WA052_01080 [Microgenomates group bacterium]
MPKVNYLERVKGLSGAIKVLKDSLNKVKGGDSDYYITLASVLRSLVAGGNKNFNPLLIDLAKINNYSLKCFGSGSISLIREILGNETAENNLVSLHPQHFITLQQFSPAQDEYSLDEWLESETMALFGKIYTPNYILRAVADTEASHYDIEQPQKYLNLKKIISETDIGQQNDVIKFLIELGDVVVYFGEKLIETISK